MVKTVTLKEPQSVDMEVVSKNTCVGLKNGEIAITVFSGNGPFEYVCNGKKSPQTTMSNLEKGNYKVYVQDAKGCTSKEQTIEITNYPEMSLHLAAGDSLNIIKTDSLEIKAQFSIDGKTVTDVQNEKLQNFSWSPYPCKDCLSVFSKKDSSATYYLKITDRYGCKISDKIRITLRDVSHDYTTPTGVTKDNPFTILPRQGDIRKINVLRIFDRWGNMMYSEKNFVPSRKIGWDGTYRGVDVDPAVYAWFAVIEYKDGFVLVVKGDVTVAR